MGFGWDGRTTTGWRYEGCHRACFSGNNTMLSVSTRRAGDLARKVHKNAVQEEGKDMDLGVMISITLMTYRCSKQKHFRASLSVRLVITYNLQAYNVCQVHLVLCAKVIVLIRALLVFSFKPPTPAKRIHARRARHATHIRKKNGSKNPEQARARCPLRGSNTIPPDLVTETSVWRSPN